MKVLVTGAKGFVGRNLCFQLNNIKEGKARWYGEVKIDTVYEYDIDSTPEQLDEWCKDCDFVFNLAGVNRPKDPKEFMEGNFGFATTLLNTLKKYKNNCPVMISSSIQATLAGRFGTSEYGKSKKAGEELMFEYGKETGAKVLVYRFPNLFGKWCRPNYNSAIATFCHNIAHDLPIQVNDRSVEMELLYIDDLVDEMISALKGEAHYCEFDGVAVVPKEKLALSLLDSSTGRYCYVPVTHKTTLGEIVDIINECADAAANKDGFNMIELPQGSLKYKLMTTYLSYLPEEKAIYDLKMNVDARGSFTELLHTLHCGQVSINISKPGITKGEHWHHSKWETFIVVSGHGLIQLRPENPDFLSQKDKETNSQKDGSSTLRPLDSSTDGIIEYEVSGEKIQAVQMLPGYTHNIINLSDKEDLVTVMYCNERFSPNRPDTYFDKVVKG